ncbi:hypothetical protein SIM22_05815 [Bacillus cereus group sp. BfR-BA-01363]|uniref:hypothetical protein n=1 Tax=Bacillus cereus group sp. BfR-BA-01363 TaxID=3094882 RepID=UPI0029C2EF6D|nr:hypothetical protein [Bacillus cereus group sp. BfR-BA-01363]MDX5853619.1 hypothetical protein [Bacillus cereus group sp. BfR-BA-01363]
MSKNQILISKEKVYSEKLLDELYELTKIEFNDERKLTKIEAKRYMEIVEYCQENNIEIPFGIQY